jgi:ABC-2 type transport system ATP-binding protein
VCALVGPNGAGKSTLLALAAGLLRPSEGRIEVFGRPAGDIRTLPSIGLVAQDRPLYPYLSVDEHLRLGRELNPRWDEAAAERLLGGLAPTDPAGALSPGQRTRLALAMALGKRPELLLLDEPMADLDPLARHEVAGVIMADAAEHGTTVVISSHILSELEPLCDHLVMLDEGRLRLAGGIEELVASHDLITAARGEDTGTAPKIEGWCHTVVGASAAGRTLTALIRPGSCVPEDWIAAAPTLEDVVLGYMRNPQAPPLLIEPLEDAVPDPSREAAAL